jgi:hypothetical protein
MSARPAPIFRARESRDEQRMQSIPKRQKRRPKNAQIPINRSDLPPVRRKGQSVSPQGGRRMRAIVVRLPQLARHAATFPAPAETLRTPKFRVAIPGAIGFRPFDCAFREQEI